MQTDQAGPVDIADVLTLPPPADVQSLYIIGVHKGGSTLFSKMVDAVAQTAQVPNIHLQGLLWQQGCKPGQVTEKSRDFIDRAGYVFNGFRGFDFPFDLPDRAENRTYVLVRDPRDCLVSRYFSVAYSHVKPGAKAGAAAMRWFDDRRQAARAAELDDYVIDEAEKTRQQFDRVLEVTRDMSPVIWRYEDVVFQKQAWMREFVAHSGLGHVSQRVKAAVRDLDVFPAAEDTNAHVRQVSPGDHAHKLRRETIQKLTEIFEDHLRLLGYLDPEFAPLTKPPSWQRRVIHSLAPTQRLSITI